MRIKVKVAEENRPFEIHYVDAEAESTVDTFLNGLVMKKLIHAGGMNNFTCSGYEKSELKLQNLKTLFSDTGKIKLTSPAATLTLTLKGGAEEQIHHWLFDYSMFIKMAHYYYDTAGQADMAPGTVFFIQHDYDKVLVEYSERHLDFYYMDNDFRALMEQTSPDMKIHFKARDELSKDELKWMRSISFPDRLPKNPVFDGTEIKSQQDVDEATVLLHRIITIIGRFQRAGKPLERSEIHFPSYVQAGEEATIGYVDRRQLRKLE